MIRINLLAVERERARKRVVLIPAAHRVTVGATVILIGLGANLPSERYGSPRATLECFYWVAPRSAWLPHAS